MEELKISCISPSLRTKKEQGRKFMLDVETDSTIIRPTIEKEQQRIKLVKEELKQSLDKKFSSWTLKRFLKKLSADETCFSQQGYVPYGWQFDDDEAIEILNDEAKYKKILSAK